MREPITLTQEELQEITGLSRASAQARWLMETYQIQAYKTGRGLSVPRLLYYQRAGIAIGKLETEKEPRMNWTALEQKETKRHPKLIFPDEDK